MNKKKIILELIGRKIGVKEAVKRLGVTRRTVERNRNRFFRERPEGLRDKRKGGNNRKLTDKDERRIVRLKLEGKHRSARFIRNNLVLPVHRETVHLLLVRHHLSRISLPPVKRIERFEAKAPNDFSR